MDSWCQTLPLGDRQLARVLPNQHQPFFSQDKFDIGQTLATKHNIPLEAHARPCKRQPHCHGPVQQAEIERQVTDFRAQGLIWPGHGVWSSPVVLVQKKDGSWRICVDYGKLNEISVKDAYHLPLVAETLGALGGSTLFSTLELTLGYWQLELEESAKENAAFATHSGLWEWEVLLFGLTSAPSTFERLLETVL